MGGDRGQGADGGAERRRLGLSRQPRARRPGLPISADAPPLLRDGRPDDGPAILALWAANGESAGDLAEPILGHLLRRTRIVVAEQDGAPVGFAAAFTVSSRLTHLADLFVLPAFQGRGIGAALLQAAFAGAGERTTFASADPRAMALYVRAGMRPWWSSMYLSGGPEALAALGPRPTTVTGEPASAAVVGAAWRELGERDRTEDLELWCARPGGTAFLVRDDRSLAAAGIAADSRGGSGRVLLRLAIAPRADPAMAVVRALRFVARPGEPVELSLPGPHPALRPLLAAGFRIVDQDTFMASRPDLVDPERLLPHPEYL